MFGILPECLSDAVNEGLIPWGNLIAEDFHVAVYKISDTIRVYAPQYPTLGVLQDCFYSAAQAGGKLLAHKHCDGFNINLAMGIVAGQDVSWPHVKLTLYKVSDSKTSEWVEP